MIGMCIYASDSLSEMEMLWMVEMDQVQRAAEPGGPRKGRTKAARFWSWLP